MSRPITDNQFNCLLRHGYRPDELREMTAGEAWKLIGEIAKAEKWSPEARSQKNRPAQGRPRNKNANARKNALAAANGKCLRCHCTTAVKAYPLPGTGKRAVLCRPCRKLVMSAAFLEYVPEYERDVVG